MDRKKRILVILAALCATAVIAVAGGVMLINKQGPSKQIEVSELPSPDKEEDPEAELSYKILVKTAEGSPVQGIMAAFYDKDGNIVGKPATTNNMGAITLKTEDESIASAKVLAVPYEYELNKEFHKFKGSKKSVSIVLNDNPNALVAQIGDEVLLFKDAIERANASEENVTIKLLGDVHYSQSFHLNNVNGKTITLDGQGHTLNMYTTSHSIKIYQSTGTVNIQNMKIEHGGLGNLILVGTNEEQKELSERVVNVNLSNLDIYSESTHEYTLINTKRMQTINMNLSDVNLVWKTAEEVKGGAIMPGVSGMEQVLNLTLKDSVIDVRQAKGAKGINAANKVTGEINLINTKILTNGAKPVSKGKMKFTRDAASYLNDGSPDEVKIGDAIYNHLSEAMEVVNNSETDVVITLLNDVNMTEHLIFENKYGKNIMLEGAGHTLTIKTNDHSMYVHQTTGIVEFSNLDIVHSGKGNVLRIGKRKNKELSEDLVTVYIIGCDIYSTSKHEYTLIHTNESQNIKLEMVKTTLVWNTPRNIKGGAIMASVSGLKQNLDLTLNNCLIDVRNAKGAKGIQAENAAQGTIKLYDVLINTMETEAVENDKMKLIIDEKTTFNNGTADEAKIGKVTYNTLEEAMIRANASTKDVTVTLLRDMDIYEPIIIDNEHGKNVVIDGDGHEITPTFDTHTIYVNQTAGTVTIANLDMDHAGEGCAIRIGERDTRYSGKLTVNLEHMDIDSKSKCKYGVIQAGYGTMALDLNMTDVSLVWKTSTKVEKGAIFAGLSGEKTNLNLTMTDCYVDASQVAKAYGISAETGVTGNLVLNNTTIKSYKGIDSVFDRNMKFTRDKDTVLSQYPATQVQIGDVIYNDLSEAIADANNSKEDVTITFLSDEVTFKDNITIKNVNGKNITIDGNNKKLVFNKAIIITQDKGTVEINDMKVEHSSGNPLFRIGDREAEYPEEALTVNLNNLDIHSTSSCKYGLIQAGYGTMALDLNMTDVNLAWETAEGVEIEKGAILAGLSGEKTTLNLTMTRCNIDTSKAAGAYGVYAESGVTGDLVLNDTKITANNTAAIVDQKMKVTSDEKTELIPSSGTQIQVGSVIYNDLSEAVEVANNSKEDVTIKFLSDEVTFKENITIKNVNGKNITIDGNNKKLVSNKVIFIYQENGTVDVKDLAVEHSSGNPLFRIGEKEKTYEGTLTVNLNNLDIESEGTSKTGLIQAGFASMALNLNMTDVNLAWNTDTTVTKGAIMAGISGATTALNLTMTDCTIDTSNANGAYGISAESGVTGNLVLNNTKITSNKESVIDQKMKFTRNTATELSTYPTTQVQIGDVVYNELSEAIADANKSQEEVTINFVSDEVTFKENITVQNVNGKNITINGNNKKLVSNKVIFIYQENGTVEVKDMTVSHSSGNPLFRIGEKGKTYEGTLIVNLNNLDIDSTSTRADGVIDAGFAIMDLTLNMTNVDLAWDTEKVATKGAITIGNKDDTKETKVNLTMTNCNVDTSDVNGAYGVYAEKNVAGNLVLNGNTTITTASDKDSVYYQNMEFTRSATTTLSKAPATQVQVGDVIYTDLSEAVEVANTSESDVTIALLSDITVSSNLTLKNENGKNIVLDGNGKTATVSAPILIYQETGLVEVKNMVVDHEKNILFRIGNKDTAYSEKLTVNLNNLDITSESNQSKGLIQTGYAAMELDVNMSGVDLTWNPTSTHAKGAITAGNADINAATKLNLTMTDCEIDASAASDGYGVYVENEVTGNLVLNKTKITSNKDSVYDQKMKFTRTTDTVLSTYPTTQIQVGNVVYNELSEAIADANASETDVTITLLNDIAISSNLTLKNVNGKNIILDGGNHKVTVSAPILIYQETGLVEVKNMVVGHEKNILFRIGNKDTAYSGKVTVNLNKLDITSKSNQSKGLIQAGYAAMELDVNMSDVDLTWNPTSTHAKGAITVGNVDSDNANAAPNLNLTMTNCDINTSNASAGTAIYAINSASGTINLINTKIVTAADTPIDNKQMILSFDKDTGFWKGTTQSVALVDGVHYSNFYDAFEKVRTATTATRIDFVHDFEYDTEKNSNITIAEDGNNVIVDGHGHTVNANKNVFFIYQKTGLVEVKNMEINHTSNILFRIGDKNAEYPEEALTVKLENIDITSTSNNSLIQAGHTTMNLTLNLEDVNLLSWTTTVAKNAIDIGTKGSPTVYLTMTDCSFDASGAIAGSKVINASNDASGTINLINTKITVAVAPAIYKNKMTLDYDANTVITPPLESAVLMMVTDDETVSGNAVPDTTVSGNTVPDASADEKQSTDDDKKDAEEPKVPETTTTSGNEVSKTTVSGNTALAQ